MRARIELSGFVALALLFSSCAGPTFAPDAAPEYVVLRETPLYRYGPQQAGPPEEWLRKDDRVHMLRREFGFSFVLSSDQQTGYVGNESLMLAPAAPKPVAETPPKARERIAPLPAEVEPPLPKPDLDAPPPDAPVSDR